MGWMIPHQQTTQSMMSSNSIGLEPNRSMPGKTRSYKSKLLRWESRDHASRNFLLDRSQRFRSSKDRQTDTHTHTQCTESLEYKLDGPCKTFYPEKAFERLKNYGTFKTPKFRDCTLDHSNFKKAT